MINLTDIDFNRLESKGKKIIAIRKKTSNYALDQWYSSRLTMYTYTHILLVPIQYF